MPSYFPKGGARQHLILLTCNELAVCATEAYLAVALRHCYKWYGQIDSLRWVIVSQNGSGWGSRLHHIELRLHSPVIGIFICRRIWELMRPSLVQRCSDCPFYPRRVIDLGSGLEFALCTEVRAVHRGSNPSIFYGPWENWGPQRGPQKTAAPKVCRMQKRGKREKEIKKERMKERKKERK